VTALEVTLAFRPTEHSELAMVISARAFTWAPNPALAAVPMATKLAKLQPIGLPGRTETVTVGAAPNNGGVVSVASIPNVLVLVATAIGP
jgi:hypothetical protein